VKSRVFLGLIILAQTACIAVGLGFHYIYMASSLNRSGEEQAKSELTEEARRLSASLAAAGVTSAADVAKRVEDGLAQQMAAHVLNGRQTTPATVLVVDRNWHVLFNPTDEASDQPLTTIPWLEAPATRPGTEQPVYGEIQLSSGTHFCAAYPLASQDGYVVAESDLETVKISPAAVRWQLATAAGISLLWMAGLMAVSVYMVVTYLREGRARQRISPEVEALKQTQALLRTQETVIFALAKLSDSRDPETGDHLERISYYSSTLAAALRQRPDFRDVVTSALVRLIGISSALHDIGKVGVEDAILKKPGSLTPAERSRMQLHTRVGEDCLKEIERRLGTSNFLQMAREIASAHHERWDGTGYPLGLAGEQIPIAARIVAIADVYDALSSKRVYKDALPHEKCVEMILEEAGKHFDPRLVEVFAQIEPSFRVISRQLGTTRDTPAGRSPVKESSPPVDESDADLAPAGIGS